MPVLAFGAALYEEHAQKKNHLLDACLSLGTALYEEHAARARELDALCPCHFAV